MKSSCFVSVQSTEEGRTQRGRALEIDNADTTFSRNIDSTERRLRALRCIFGRSYDLKSVPGSQCDGVKMPASGMRGEMQP